ncbi:hypothetical protein DPMN_019623 [Dreissena polymorpha]|uniref:Uncharacterized protein n=1 Tax=Dreissena polymorpha TaxID=45954 RepID=A0A9D4NL55_DREPO|nr:hypothetical protein DPMN_019623 [Dreissena polymorpha]
MTFIFCDGRSTFRTCGSWSTGAHRALSCLTGRAGSDGDPALALVFAYPRSITDCNDAMKTMVNGTECVRRTVLKELRTKDMNPIPAQGNGCQDDTCEVCVCQLCICCNRCSRSCTCFGACPDNLL